MGLCDGLHSDLDPDGLYFSSRACLEKLFEADCDKRRLKKCAMNFLAWLPSCPEGRKAIEIMAKEILIDKKGGLHDRRGEPEDRELDKR